MRRLLPLLALGAACGGEPAEEPAAGPEAVAETTPAAPPGTDIWLASLSRDGAGGLTVGEPRNVTDRPGYDNQPFFLPDGSGFWYTRIDEAGQADIWRFDLASGTSAPVTETAPESEYSATPLPDRSGFSAIRVEADSTQRLWRFDADGGNASVLLPELAPVGYQAWADDHHLMLFVLGDPPTLRLANATTGRVAVHGQNIGRSLQRIPASHHVSFVQRHEDGSATLMRHRPGTGESEALVEALDGGDFHAWTPDGTLLMGSGSRLHSWTADAGAGWALVADLSSLGITITRLAVSPDGSQIAIVGEAGAG